MKVLVKIPILTAFMLGSFSVIVPALAAKSSTTAIKCADIIRAASHLLTATSLRDWDLAENLLVEKLKQDGESLILELAEQAAHEPEAVIVLRKLAETRKLSEAQLLLVVDVLMALAEGRIGFPFESAFQNEDEAMRTHPTGRRRWTLADESLIRVDSRSRLRALQSFAWIYEHLDGYLPVSAGEPLPMWLIAVGHRLLEDPSFVSVQDSDRDEASWRDQMLFALVNLTNSYLLTKPGGDERRFIRDGISELHQAMIERTTHLPYFDGHQQLDDLLRTSSLFSQLPDLLPEAQAANLIIAYKTALSGGFPMALRSAALNQMLEVYGSHFVMSVQTLNEQRQGLREASESLSAQEVSKMGGLFDELLKVLDTKIEDAMIFFELWVHGSSVHKDLDRRLFTANLDEAIIERMFQALRVEEYSARVAELIRSRWQRDDDHPDRAKKMKLSIASAFHRADSGMHRFLKIIDDGLYVSETYQRARRVLESLRLPIGLMSLKSRVEAQMMYWPEPDRREVQWLLTATTEELAGSQHSQWGTFSSMKPVAFMRAMRRFRESFSERGDLQAGSRSFEEIHRSLMTATSIEDNLGVPVQMDDIILERFERVLVEEDTETDEQASQLSLPGASDLDGMTVYRSEVKRYAALYYILLELQWNRRGGPMGKEQWQFLSRLYFEESSEDSAN